AVAELHTHDDAVREVVCAPSSLIDLLDDAPVSEPVDENSIDIRQTLSDNSIKDMLDYDPVNEPVDENSLKDLNDPANTVVCHLCGKRVPSKTAHLHQERWIGDACCWDERLRSSE
ncbi:hypothetical protein, partial [Candidatus Magnetobacterium casense]|uniref:hypothetical protein n=1 Tax=Candidatus Magnetobacterium casense TaxID=1455061 RepID=UPI001C48CEEE